RMRHVVLVRPRDPAGDGLRRLRRGAEAGERGHGNGGNQYHPVDRALPHLCLPCPPRRGSVTLVYESRSTLDSAGMGKRMRSGRRGTRPGGVLRAETDGWIFGSERNVRIRRGGGRAVPPPELMSSGSS